MKQLSLLAVLLLALAACGETPAATPSPTTVPWATTVVGEQAQEAAIVKGVSASANVTYDVNTDTLLVVDTIPDNTAYIVPRVYHLLRAIYGPEQKRVPFSTTIALQGADGGELFRRTLDEADQIPWDWTTITPGQVVAAMH